MTNIFFNYAGIVLENFTFSEKVEFIRNDTILKGADLGTGFSSLMGTKTDSYEWAERNQSKIANEELYTRKQPNIIQYAQ